MESVIEKCRYRKSIRWEDIIILMTHIGRDSFNEIYGKPPVIQFADEAPFDTSNWLVNKFKITISYNFKSACFITHGSYYDYLNGIKTYSEYDIFRYFLGGFFWKGYLGSLPEDQFNKETFLFDDSDILAYKKECRKIYKRLYRLFGDEFPMIYQKFYNKIHPHENQLDNN